MVQFNAEANDFELEPSGAQTQEYWDQIDDLRIIQYLVLENNPVLFKHSGKVLCVMFS